MLPGNDPYDLARFIRAQDPVFEGVLAELRAGAKRSHWMWFIFPQIDGLGFSSTTKYYSIKSRAEARQYLDHPVLGPRLVQCVEILLALEGTSAVEVFGSIDAMKLKSSLTLFAAVGPPASVFDRLLEKYYGGERDGKTVQLLGPVDEPGS